MIEDAKSSQKNWQYLYPKDDASSLQPHQSPTSIPAILEERGGQDRVDICNGESSWHMASWLQLHEPNILPLFVDRQRLPVVYPSMLERSLRIHFHTNQHTS